jgi:hypothetical protein
MVAAHGLHHFCQWLVQPGAEPVVIDREGQDQHNKNN